MEQKEYQGKQLNGPAGPGGPGMGGTPGEKSKNFKGTWGKLLLACRKYWGILVVAFLCAIAGTIFTLVGPDQLSKLTKLDLTTSLFASAPGGVSDMAIIASELGADPAKVAALQTLRLIVVIVLFPTLVTWVSRIM